MKSLLRVFGLIDSWLKGWEDEYLHRNDPIMTTDAPESPKSAPGQAEAPQQAQTADPTLSILERFCLAIRDYEGAPGDRNYKNNNPGNCRFSSVGYLSKYEPVKKDKDNFAIFPSMAIGFMYLENLVREKVSKNPTQSILQFMEEYAPTSDGNDPMLYASFIAKRLGVSVSFNMNKVVNV